MEYFRNLFYGISAILFQDDRLRKERILLVHHRTGSLDLPFDFQLADFRTLCRSGVLNFDLIVEDDLAHLVLVPIFGVGALRARVTLRTLNQRKLLSGNHTPFFTHFLRMFGVDFHPEILSHFLVRSDKVQNLDLVAALPKGQSPAGGLIDQESPEVSFGSDSDRREIQCFAVLASNSLMPEVSGLVSSIRISDTILEE